jgi:hypothetical protein
MPFVLDLDSSFIYAIFNQLGTCIGLIIKWHFWHSEFYNMSKGVHKIFDLVITFWELINSQNMLHLVFLKLLRLLKKLWPKT